MGKMGILMRIDDGVYVCIYTIYTAALKQFTQHAFFYDSHFSTKEKVNAVVQSFIIDNIHPSVY